MTAAEVARAARRVANQLDTSTTGSLDDLRLLDTLADVLRMLADELDPQEDAG